MRQEAGSVHDGTFWGDLANSVRCVMQFGDFSPRSPFPPFVRPPQGGRTARWPSVVLAVLAAASGLERALRADEPEFVESRILAPTLGRPVFVVPGGSFELAVALEAPVGASQAWLSGKQSAGRRHRLELEADSAAANQPGRPIRVAVPADVPAGTYDLIVAAGGQELLARHCVAIGQFEGRLRFVHISDMHVGDPLAPEPDARLIDEINLWGPDVIVATGDYVDATHANPSAGWKAIEEFLASFDAPVVMACGDHDDLTWYSRHAAPSPVGEVRIGKWRGLVLCDHALARALDDEAQMRWIEQALSQPAESRHTFVVAHEHAPELLRSWQERGLVAQMIESGRIAAWFCGGPLDDAGEYADVLKAARPMLWVRTHQASPVARDGATGLSHYRVLDASGDTIVPVGEPTAEGALPASLEVGRLGVHIEGRNDGSRERLRATVVNALPMRAERLVLRLRLRKRDGVQPWCQGGTLRAAVDRGEFWECCVSVDVPERGAVTLLAGIDNAPTVPSLNVRFDAPDAIEFAPRAGPDGRPYLWADGAFIDVEIENAGRDAAAVFPMLRIDGQPLAYMLPDENPVYAAGYRTTLLAGQRLRLRVDVSAIRVRAGPRELQLYLRAGQADAPICHVLNVVVSGSRPAGELAATAP